MTTLQTECNTTVVGVGNTVELGNVIVDSLQVLHSTLGEQDLELAGAPAIRQLHAWRAVEQRRQPLLSLPAAT